MKAFDIRKKDNKFDIIKKKIKYFFERIFKFFQSKLNFHNKKGVYNKTKYRLNKKKLLIAAAAVVAAAGIITGAAFAIAGSGAKAAETEVTAKVLQAETYIMPPPAEAPQETDKKPGLKPEEHSNEVIKLQERLMELNYMEYDEPTDYYGPQTEYALQLFQRKNNLQIDGIAGEETLKILNSKEAKRYTVSLGAKGTDVTELQKRLIELKYLKGKATGHFGTDTENAVKLFQKQCRLAVDGSVGENTREELYAEDAPKYKAPAAPKKKTVKQPTKTTTKLPDEKKVNALIAFAKKQLGKKYVRGGKGPDTFDCSGFVYYCLKSTGKKIGYMTSAGWAQSDFPRVTKMKYLKPGDICCFRGHVGIYLGGGKMIDASSGQGVIRVTENILASKYWTGCFRCGRRVLYK